MPVPLPLDRRPDWLAQRAGGRRAVLAVPGPGRPVSSVVWRPGGLSDDRPAPLLVVHDGTDFVVRGALLRWATARSAVNPARLLLLDPWPGRRPDCYAANPTYAEQLAERILPAALHRVATSAVVGWGASLGALAMLDLHRRYPHVLHGLVLQSGSFFTTTFDPQESGWPQFAAVCAAVQAVERDGVRPVPVALTCGTEEENLANNQRMADTLARWGADVTVQLVRAGHTMTCFSGAWTPAVDDLLDRLG